MSADVPTDETVLDALATLRAQGYAADFSLSGEALRCSVCGHRHGPDVAVIIEIVRFEGASNPDDEAIVFGLECAHCGARGTLVSAYGPTASAEEAAIVVGLLDRRSR